jgi:hypothetical protein
LLEKALNCGRPCSGIEHRHDGCFNTESFVEPFVWIGNERKGGTQLMLQHSALWRVENCDFLDAVFCQLTMPLNERLKMQIADGAACEASEL